MKNKKVTDVCIIENLKLWRAVILGWVMSHIKISIGLNALWHSITFDVFLQIQQNFQWSLKLQLATGFYVNQCLCCCKHCNFDVDCHVWECIVVISENLECFSTSLIYLPAADSLSLDHSQLSHYCVLRISFIPQYWQSVSVKGLRGLFHRELIFFLHSVIGWLSHIRQLSVI